MELKPGYKQTDVGVIPEEWEVKPLGQLSEFVTSGSRGWAKHYSDRGSLFVRSQNIRDGRLDFTDRQCVIPPAGSEGSRTRLNCNDLLITITGNSVGNVAWVERDLGDAYISQHVGLVRLLEPRLGEYVCVFLAPGSPGNRQIWASQTGQSKPGLNLKNLEDFLVALPPSPEQRSIATAVSDWDAFMESLEQLIAKKRHLKQGAMQELLTGKKRLPGFSGEWKLKTFGEIFDYHSTATNSRSELSEAGDTYYIHYGDIHTRFHNHLNFSTERPPRIERHRCKNATLLQNGDWIMADASEDFDGVGKSIEILGLDEGVPAIAGLHTFLLREKCPTFAAGFKGHLGNLSSLHEQFLRVATGMKVFGVSKAALKDLTLSVPDREEQAAIAAILTDMDAEIAALEAKLAKTRQIKQGMMHNLLTGRIRLV